jgi:hypothetical protein
LNVIIPESVKIILKQNEQIHAWTADILNQIFFYAMYIFAIELSLSMQVHVCVGFRAMKMTNLAVQETPSLYKNMIKELSCIATPIK